MVDSVFNVNHNQPDCSIFAPQDGYGAETVLSFVRSTLRVNNNLTQPRLNSSGETQLSFASIGAFLGELQPTRGAYPRFIQGTMIQVDFVFYIIGEADIREGDRATAQGHRVEVVAVNNWGSEQTDVSLKQLGR